MSETIELSASDGHKLAAYLAQPNGTAKGGIVVIQEIFGVNSHMRTVADDFAAEGYLAIVPALFDRIEPGIELGYEQNDITQGLEYKNTVGNDDPIMDVAAARDVVKSAGKVGVVGYCWGGALTWLAACKLDGLSAASSYYGGGIGGMMDLDAKCPVSFHFGEEDHAIPMAEVNTVKVAKPACPVHVYPAGHGFNCEQRGSHHPESKKIARERTLELFAKHVG
ncbi:MAG: carboxymethylenebutenolidase [Rhodospirillaceae bacterium]|nr:carboxymethylenebutenolidase [Rhodospirillaceae bacterium]